jgi:hypothetical protein
VQSEIASGFAGVASDPGRSEPRIRQSASERCGGVGGGEVFSGQAIKEAKNAEERIRQLSLKGGKRSLKLSQVVAGVSQAPRSQPTPPSLPTLKYVNFQMWHVPHLE